MTFQYWVTVAEKAAQKAERKAKRETTDDIVSKIYVEAVNALSKQRKTLADRKADWDPADGDSFEKVEAEVTRLKRVLTLHKDAIATLMDKADDLVKEHYPKAAAAGKNEVAAKSQSVESTTTGKSFVISN